MDITYLGHSCFKIKTKTATVITDPFDPKTVGFKLSGAEGEIVTISHEHADHNAAEKVSGVQKIIEGPGEYEIKGVSIMGYPSFHDSKKGEERGKNTVYVFEVEGLRVVHLGDLGHLLSDNLIGEIGAVDILIVPVGGTFTLDPKEAVEIANKIDPYYIIPMHYKTSELDETNFAGIAEKESFLKEIGKTVEVLPKLSVKKSDIIDEQSAKVIILEKK